jgi:hypothetical protein
LIVETILVTAQGMNVQGWMGLALALSWVGVASAHEKQGEKPVCHHGDNSAACAPAGASSKKDWEAGKVLVRGDKISPGPRLNVQRLLDAPSNHQGKSVRVEGDVRQACTRKGCWMELAPSAQTKGPGVRVTFKDYGFFVPLDSAGAKASVEGIVQVSELSEETARHYESEGATVPRGKDGKPREIQLVAQGVELRR